MFQTIRSLVLQLLNVPDAPQPPAGAPGSLHVFRAAPNFYKLCLLRWGVSQTFAFVGLIVALVFLHGPFGDDMLRRHPNLRPLEALIFTIEGFGLVAFFLQLPVTYAITRLDYELRWYLVTDRSLRIRSGVWTVEELTMTFANIQEITLHQGPLQRFLGIADLKVRSAGGGSATHDGTKTRETHVGYFRGIENAASIRDLILANLRRQKDTGLGDPDATAAEPLSSLAPVPDSLAAAREVLAETRTLRAALESQPNLRSEI